MGQRENSNTSLLLTSLLTHNSLSSPVPSHLSPCFTCHTEKQCISFFWVYGADSGKIHLPRLIRIRISPPLKFFTAFRMHLVVTWDVDKVTRSVPGFYRLHYPGAGSDGDRTASGERRHPPGPWRSSKLSALRAPLLGYKIGTGTVLTSEAAGSRGNAPGTQGELGGCPPLRLGAAHANFGAAHCAGPFAAGRARRTGVGAGRAEPGAALTLPERCAGFKGHLRG